jgi:hypothetical protein
MDDPNPDLEKGNPFSACHCEHLKGACLHAEVTFRHAGVAMSLKRARLLRFARKDRILNRDLGMIKSLNFFSIVYRMFAAQGKGQSIKEKKEKREHSSSF